MKAYKFNEEKGNELMKKVQEVVGQMSLGDFLMLSKKLENSVNQKAEVHFSSAAYYKMNALVAACDKEIAWDGTAFRDEENPNVFYITDIIVYPQMVSGATVDTDDEKYLTWMNSLDDETFNHRRFNGHSHVNMGVTPSGTDTTYREQSILNIKDFFIYGIFNKKGDFNFQIYDVENNIIYDNADVIFYTPEPDYSDWAKEEMLKHVTIKPVTTTYQYTNYAKPNTPGTANAAASNTNYASQNWYKGRRDWDY